MSCKHTYTVYTDAHSCIAHEGRSHLFLTLHQSLHLVLRFFRVYTSDYIRTDVKLNCFCLSFLASSFWLHSPSLCLHCTQRVCFGTRDLVAKKQMSKTSAAFTGGEHLESCVLCTQLWLSLPALIRNNFKWDFKSVNSLSATPEFKSSLRSWNTVWELCFKLRWVSCTMEVI